MDRDSRRLSHQKGNKVITQLQPPLSSDGDDGDQIVVGAKLYTKSDGRWFSIDSEQKSDGWHGSSTRVKVLPLAFKSSNSAYDAYYPNALATHSGSITDEVDMVANVVLPVGYKAYKAKIYGSSGGSPNREWKAFSSNYDDSSFVPLMSPVAFGVEGVFDTTFIGNESNYIVFVVAGVRGSSYDDIHGGYIGIKK